MELTGGINVKRIAKGPYWEITLNGFSHGTYRKDEEASAAIVSHVNYLPLYMAVGAQTHAQTGAQEREQTMMQTKTTNYQITDYGIENADYFQGHGTAFTRYEHCALGCGDSYAEALDDALDSAAQCGFDIELSPEDEPAKFEGKGPMASEQKEGDDEDMNGDLNLYYYVGLRWN